MLTTLLFPQPSFADESNTSHDDTRINTEVTQHDWLTRNRDLDPISLLPGESGTSSFKEYTPFSCADFNVEAPDGWGVSHNASDGVIGITAPLDAQPGHYDITVTDASECFPVNPVTTTLGVTVKQPEIAYHLNDAQELIATYKDGTAKNISSPDHNSHDDGIIGYTIEDNNVVSVKTNDGRFHNLYGDMKGVDLKDNHSKGIFSLSYDHNGNGIIIATDGSMYVVDAMENNASITNMSVVGDGKLIVVTSDGTAQELGVIKDSIYPGVASVFAGDNDSLVMKTTGGQTYRFNKDNSNSGNSPSGLATVSMRDNEKVYVTTDEGSVYHVGIADQSSDVPNPEDPELTQKAPSEINSKGSGIDKNNGYTSAPKSRESKEGNKEKTLWEKIIDIFR